jgi:hypothetical protein
MDDWVCYDTDRCLDSFFDQRKEKLMMIVCAVRIAAVLTNVKSISVILAI